MWTLSHITCNAVEKLNIGYDDAELVVNNINPSTHMEITEAKRLTRSSEFEKGYEEFLRNYNHDNNIASNGDQGHHYRVEESDENAGFANDEGSADHDDDDDDDDGSDNEDDESNSESNEAAAINDGYIEYSSGSESDSDESSGKRKSYKAKPQNKGKSSNDKKKHKNAEKKTKPKKKKCKTERHDNMLCTVCYNPISDEKSESCSYSSEPKEHNYAYSEDSSFGGNKKKKEPESLESDESYESDNESEGQTIKPEKKNPPTNKYPVYNGRKPKPPAKSNPSSRPQPNRKYGPQTFDIPQSFQITRSSGRPSQYKTKKSPPKVTLLRYRTVENPFTSERIRLIVPAVPHNHPNSKQKQKQKQKPFPKKPLPPNDIPDVRPPRDVNNGAQTESLLSNVTKLSEFEYLPSHLNDEASRHSVTFTNKDGLKCKKSSDGNKVCFECFVDGERRKECMFSKTHKPTRFFESYTTSKKSKHSLGSLNPLNFDATPAPKPKHSHGQHKSKPKPPATKQTKNKKLVNSEEESSFFPMSEELGFSTVKKVSAETEADWSLNPKTKQKQELKERETEADWSLSPKNKQKQELKQLETEVDWSLSPKNKQKQELKHLETEADWSLSPKNKQKQEIKQLETEADWSLNPKSKQKEALKQPETVAEWSLNSKNKHKQLDTVIEWNVNHNDQQYKPVKSQTLRAVPEVIYGTPQPASESYTIYYEPQPVKFIADTSSRTVHVN